MSKICCLVSGGMDSAAMVALLQHEGHEVSMLHVNYGQAATTLELTAFRKQAELFNPVTAGIISITGLGRSVFDADVKGAMVIPYRNLLLLSAASVWNDGWADKLAYGAIAADYQAYPDCTTEFEAAISLVFERYDCTRLKAIRPLALYTKVEIVALLRGYEVPLDITYSCYGGQAIPCGQCASCKLKLAAILTDAAIGD